MSLFYDAHKAFSIAVFFFKSLLSRFIHSLEVGLIHRTKDRKQSRQVTSSSQGNINILNNRCITCLN